MIILLAVMIIGQKYSLKFSKKNSLFFTSFC